MSKINQMKYPVSTCRRDVKAPPSPTVPPLLAIPSSASLTLINIFPPEWAPHARARAEDQPYNYLFLTFPASACYEDHVTLPETTRIKAMIVTLTTLMVRTAPEPAVFGIPPGGPGRR